MTKKGVHRTIKQEREHQGVESKMQTEAFRAWSREKLKLYKSTALLLFENQYSVERKHIHTHILESKTWSESHLVLPPNRSVINLFVKLL